PAASERGRIPAGLHAPLGEVRLRRQSRAQHGRGPVDLKVSMGSGDKSLIEFKLAGNSQLKRNLERQVEIYERANKTSTSVKVIICFTEAHQRKVHKILEELELTGDASILVINARNDDKPSASKA